ncbi:MAG: FG-GAP-like repeat-containing protein [Cyanobacteria bacterium J06598_1]
MTTFNQKTGSANPFETATVTDYSRPALADIDGDGDLDLVVGDGYGYLAHYENTGNETNPTYSEKTSGSPFASIQVAYNSTPVFADIDGDGKLDLVIGDYYGGLSYHKNTGTATAPTYTEQTGTDNPFDTINVGSYSTPTFADIDDDGKVDLVVGDGNGYLHYYKRTDPATNTLARQVVESTTPQFTKQTDNSNPFQGIQVGRLASPAFTDVDGDGDLDLALGEEAGFNYYKNTGSAASPVFTKQMGEDNPFVNVNVDTVGSYIAPIFADIDGDGSVDLIAGDDGGEINLFQKDTTTTPTTPTDGALLSVPTDTKAVQVNQLGSFDTLQLHIDQLNVTDVSEILIFSVDDASGANPMQIASFSLLEDGQLPDAFEPTFALDKSLIAEGKFLQFAIVENGQRRTSTPVSQTGSLVELDFGGGTRLGLQPIIELDHTHLLVNDAEAIDLTGVGNSATLSFNVYREASYNSTVGFYTTDTADGAITDPLTNATLRPGDSGYKEAALARSLETQLTGTNGQVNSFSATFAGGGFVSTYLIVDGSDPASGEIRFAHGSANSGGHDHVKLLGNNTFGFEDMSGLGDRDFNDVVVEFTVA